MSGDHGWDSGSMGVGRRFGLTIAVIVALGTVVLLGIAALLVLLLSSTPSPRAIGVTQAASSPAPTWTGRDPYAIYLQHAGWKSGWMTREEAQARAYLGCGQTFAPKTVDAVLADAYRPTGICAK